MSPLAVAPTGSTVLAPTAAALRAAMDDPWSLLPQAVAQAAWRVWSCYQHVNGFEKPLSLCALLAEWMSEDGLTPEDAVACLKATLRPGRVKGNNFASNVVASLADAVEAILDLRAKEARRAADTRQRREADEQARRTALPPDEVRERLRAAAKADTDDGRPAWDLGRMPG